MNCNPLPSLIVSLRRLQARRSGCQLARHLALAMALLAVGAASQPAAAAFSYMRALHMGGNWGGNQEGIRSALPDASGTGRSEYFDYLKSENVEWIGLSVAIFYDGLSDPTVKVKYRPAGDTSFDIYTFDDGDLRNFIASARQQGFRVYLTLAFELSWIPVSTADPKCRTPDYKVNRSMLGEPAVVGGDLWACVDPAHWWWSPAHPDHATNIARFWETYTQVAVKYAALAQQSGVELFSLGTETENLFRSRSGEGAYTNHFGSQLARMVNDVRAVYSGAVTYTQHHSVLVNPEWFGGGAGTARLFADLGLDVIGISAYLPLVISTPTAVMSVPELEAAWESIFQKHLIPLQAANPGKPIVFTEFGYNDDLVAPADPLANAFEPAPPRNAQGVTDGMLQQQNILQAFFNVDDRHGNLVRGAFLWGNEVFTNQTYLCELVTTGIYCKPAAQSVRDVYARWRTAGEAMPVPATVVEFLNAGLMHFFVTADPAEIGALDGGAFGGAWVRTGNAFGAWPVGPVDGGTTTVCRFFGTDRYRSDGSRIGPNSHFYTADPSECDHVRTAWQSLASDGLHYPAWTFESHAFLVRLPSGGLCPANSRPLYRAYNSAANGDPNHRYHADKTVLEAMAGWVFEGLVMCVAP